MLRVGRESAVPANYRRATSTKVEAIERSLQKCRSCLSLAVVVAWLALVRAPAQPRCAASDPQSDRLTPFALAPLFAGLERSVRQPEPRQLQCGPFPPATPGRPGRAATRRRRCHPRPCPRCCKRHQPSCASGPVKGVAIWRERVGRHEPRARCARRGAAEDKARALTPAGFGVQGYPQMMPQVNTARWRRLDVPDRRGCKHTQPCCATRGGERHFALLLVPPPWCTSAESCSRSLPPHQHPHPHPHSPRLLLRMWPFF